MRTVITVDIGTLVDRADRYLKSRGIVDIDKRTQLIENAVYYCITSCVSVPIGVCAYDLLDGYNYEGEQALDEVVEGVEALVKNSERMRKVASLIWTQTCGGTANASAVVHVEYGFIRLSIENDYWNT